MTRPLTLEQESINIMESLKLIHKGVIQNMNHLFWLNKQFKCITHHILKKRHNNTNWLVVIKTKARSTIDARGYAISQTQAYQEVENVQVLPVTLEVEQIDNLRDNGSNFEEVDDDPTNDGSTNDEVESEELEEFYYSDSTNEDIPADYVGSDDD